MAGLLRCLQSQRLAWSLQPVQRVRRLHLAAGQQSDIANRELTNALALLTAAAIIVLNGKRTYRTLGGESNRLLH